MIALYEQNIKQDEQKVTRCEHLKIKYYEQMSSHHRKI
jgi:hypothetical protein